MGWRRKCDASVATRQYLHSRLATRRPIRNLTSPRRMSNRVYRKIMGPPVQRMKALAGPKSQCAAEKIGRVDGPRVICSPTVLEETDGGSDRFALKIPLRKFAASHACCTGRPIGN